QHTVAKYGKSAPDDYTRQIFSPPTLDGDGDDDSAAAAARAGQARQRVLRDLREQVAEAVAAPIANLFSLADAARDDDDDANASPVPTDAAAIADAARKGLADDALLRLFLEAQPAFDEAEAGPSLRGDLRVVPIAEVLQLLDAQNQTGIL